MAFSSFHTLRAYFLRPNFIFAVNYVSFALYLFGNNKFSIWKEADLFVLNLGVSWRQKLFDSIIVSNTTL